MYNRWSTADSRIRVPTMEREKPKEMGRERERARATVKEFSEKLEEQWCKKEKKSGEKSGNLYTIIFVYIISNCIALN